MKNTHFIAIALLFAATSLTAQAPGLIPWQGFFQDKNNQASTLDLRFRILYGSTSGAIAFEEIQPTVQVMKSGVASHVIGSINTAGLAAIDWNNGPYFLEVARYKTGSGYEVVGTPEQLKSVPYALEAKGLDMPFVKQGVVGEAFAVYNATGTGATLAMPNRAAFFNGNVYMQNGAFDLVNAGGYVHLEVAPNAGMELHGSSAYIDFAKDAATDFNARLILQGDDRMAYNSPGGHVFYAGKNGVYVVGDGDESRIFINGASSTGFIGFKGTGSMQLSAPGHMDYHANGGGNHNFYGGGIRVSGAQQEQLSNYTYFINAGVPFNYLTVHPLATSFQSGGGGVQPYSIYANQRMACSELDVFSDRRIKNVVGISDSRRDLDVLGQIQITDYFFKDPVSKGARPQKKVIGQQVAEVFPQAVSTDNTEIVPDIMQMATADQGWVALKNHSLKPGEKVRLIFEKGKEDLEVIETTAEGFRVASGNSGDVFVYGREVSDFHIVDYEAIAMLNVSATQELAKQVADLKQQLAQRDAQLNAALSLLQSLQQDVAALKSGRTTETLIRTEDK